ncbi:MAG: hypothetical protein ACRC33_06275, partial [Gemmataceae bacterium]
MEELTGVWKYRSYVPHDTSEAHPDQLALPWAASDEVKLAADADGKVTGTMTAAGGTAFAVTGKVTAAVPGKMGKGVELTVTGPGGSVYRIRAYFLPGVRQLAGVTLAVK